ncbi:MAG: hypothetical protein VX642_06530 [Bdellovibrionota bacterium]|nr:hypothetical protein [Bdellovibrionota bacterium]
MRNQQAIEKSNLTEKNNNLDWVNLKDSYTIYLNYISKGFSESWAIQQVLDSYGFKINDESIFKECTENRVVEAFLYNSFNPIFLNKYFFDLVSYDVDMVSYRNVFDLFERNQTIESKTLEVVKDSALLKKKFDPNLPPAVIRETEAEGRSFYNEYKWVCGFRYEGVPMGFINVMDAKRLDDTKTSIF